METIFCIEKLVENQIKLFYVKNKDFGSMIPYKPKLRDPIAVKEPNNIRVIEGRSPLQYLLWVIKRLIL